MPRGTSRSVLLNVSYHEKHEYILVRGESQEVSHFPAGDHKQAQGQLLSPTF